MYTQKGTPGLLKIFEKLEAIYLEDVLGGVMPVFQIKDGALNYYKQGMVLIVDLLWLPLKHAVIKTLSIKN